MTPERTQELRQVFKQGAPRLWISMFNAGKLSGSELKFLSEKWMEMKGRPMDLDKQAGLLANRFGGEIV